MSKCEHCNNQRTINTTSSGIAVVQPCPTCNRLNDDFKDGKYLREVLSCIQNINKTGEE